MIQLSGSKVQKRQQISHSNVSVLAGKFGAVMKKHDQMASKGQLERSSHTAQSNRSKRAASKLKATEPSTQSDKPQTQFADKVAKLKELKSKATNEQDQEENQDHHTFRVNKNDNAIKAAEQAVESSDQYIARQELQSVKWALGEQLGENKHTSSHKQRSSSVTSNNYMYTCFQKEISRQNLLNNPNVISRNANISSTCNDDKQDGIFEKQRKSQVESRLHQKRFTIEGEQGTRDSRNLKELIFVDSKAFQNNAEGPAQQKMYPTKPDALQKDRSGIGASRKRSTCQGVHDRTSQASRSGYRRKKSDVVTDKVISNRLTNPAVNIQLNTTPQINDYIAINKEIQSGTNSKIPWAANTSPLILQHSRTSNDGGNECRLSNQDSVKNSITRARHEHRRNLDEINRINDSVKYSARRSNTKDVNRSDSSVDTKIEGVLSMVQDHNLSGAKEYAERQLSVTQSMALKHIPLDNLNRQNLHCENLNYDHLNSSAHKSIHLSRVQSTERGIPENQIEKLQQNLAKLEKLEKRLMRGDKKNKKQLDKSESRQDNVKVKDEKKKNKKKGKNWRNAYDLYCKELVNPNQIQVDSQKSQDRLKDLVMTGEQTTKSSAPRYAVTNSMARRQHILRQIAANKEIVGQIYMNSNNLNSVTTSQNLKESMNSGVNSKQQNSRRSSQTGQIRRLIQTAAEQTNHRASSKAARNSRQQQKSRISTAGAPEKSTQNLQEEAFPDAPHSQIASPQNQQINHLNAAYPVCPAQPMLSDRSQTRHITSNLPHSLQQSPERDEIILFAPMQTSVVKHKTFGQPTRLSAEYIGIGGHEGSIDPNYVPSTSHNRPSHNKHKATNHQINRFNKRVGNKVSRQSKNTSPVRSSRRLVEDNDAGQKLNISCFSNTSRRRDLAICEMSPHVVGLDQKFVLNGKSHLTANRTQELSPAASAKNQVQTMVKHQLVASI